MTSRTPSLNHLLLMVLPLALACASPSDEPPDDGATTPDDAGLVEGFESVRTREEFEDASRAQTAVWSMLRVADGFFDFDPTLDPTRTAEENAALVQARCTEELRGCGTVTRMGTTVQVDFGAAPGCTLNGVQVSGGLTLALSKVDTTITVSFAFSSFMVGDRVIDGSLAFVTDDGSTLTVTLDLTTLALDADLVVLGTEGAFEVDGTMTQTKADGTRVQYAFMDVGYRRGDCYPSSGAMAITGSGPSTTVTFSDETANTGTVTITRLGRTFTAQLPSYGGCPAEAPRDAGVVRDAAGVDRDGGVTRDAAGVLDRDGGPADAGLRRDR